jgi:hypothetical protein
MIDPLAKLWRVYFFILHGDEETSLRHCDCFELVSEVKDAREVEVHIVDCQVGGGAQQVVLVGNAKDVPH